MEHLIRLGRGFAALGILFGVVSIIVLIVGLCVTYPKLLWVVFPVLLLLMAYIIGYTKTAPVRDDY